MPLGRVWQQLVSKAALERELQVLPKVTTQIVAGMGALNSAPPPNWPAKPGQDEEIGDVILFTSEAVFTFYQAQSTSIVWLLISCVVSIIAIAEMVLTAGSPITMASALDAAATGFKLAISLHDAGNDANDKGDEEIEGRPLCSNLPLVVAKIIIHSGAIAAECCLPSELTSLNEQLADSYPCSSPGLS